MDTIIEVLPFIQEKHHPIPPQFYWQDPCHDQASQPTPQDWCQPNHLDNWGHSCKHSKHLAGQICWKLMDEKTRTLIELT